MIPSSFMASMCPVFLNLIIVFMAFMSTPSLLVLADEPQLPTSTISAAPALLPLPDSPLVSPPAAALSPDITPLFPSPGGSGPSPSESSMPTIPSSPSPPNPDAIEAPGPAFGLPPIGAIEKGSSPPPLKVSGFLASAIVSAFFVLWW